MRVIFKAGDYFKPRRFEAGGLNPPAPENSDIATGERRDDRSAAGEIMLDRSLTHLFLDRAAGLRL